MDVIFLYQKHPDGTISMDLEEEDLVQHLLLEEEYMQSSIDSQFEKMKADLEDQKPLELNKEDYQKV